MHQNSSWFHKLHMLCRYINFIVYEKIKNLGSIKFILKHNRGLVYKAPTCAAEEWTASWWKMMELTIY